MYLLLRELTLFKISVHQLFTGLGSRLDHLFTQLLGFLLQLCRNLSLFIGGTHVGFVPVDRLHADQIDNTGKFIFGTDIELNRNRIGTQAALELLYYAQEIGTGTIHLIDECDAGHLVLVGLTPYGLRLWLNATYRTEHGTSAVKDSE